jgi:hypothetical protein
MAFLTFNLIVGARFLDLGRLACDRATRRVPMTARAGRRARARVLAWRSYARWTGSAGRTTAASGVERKRRQTTWLKAMSGERAGPTSVERVRALDILLVVAVVLALIAFELWLLLFAGSPLPGG